MTALPTVIRDVCASAAAMTVDGRRDRVVGPVVLADPDVVEADLLDQPDALEDVADALPGAGDLAGDGVGVDVAERVHPEFHAHANASTALACSRTSPRGRRVAAGQRRAVSGRTAGCERYTEVVPRNARVNVRSRCDHGHRRWLDVD